MNKLGQPDNLQIPGEKYPRNFGFNTLPPPPVVACIELTQSRTGSAANLAPFVTRVIPPNAEHPMAAAVCELRLRS